MLTAKTLSIGARVCLLSYPVLVNVGGYYSAIKQRIDSYYTAIESCIYLLSVATLYLKIGEVHAIQRMIMFPHPPFHAVHFSVDAVA